MVVGLIAAAIVQGALPLQSEGHLERLTNAENMQREFGKVVAVLTLNKDFELERYAGPKQKTRGQNISF